MIIKSLRLGLRGGAKIIIVNPDDKEEERLKLLNKQFNAYVGQRI